MLAALLLLATLSAGANEPLRSWPPGSVQASWWLDEAGSASLDDARRAFAQGEGQPTDPLRIMPLGGTHAVWYELRLPQVDAPSRAVLAVPFPGIDRADLYRPADRGGWAGQSAGDSLPVAQWPVPYLHPAFSFTLGEQEWRASYLRVQHSHPIAVRWELWDANGFIESSKLWHMVLGATMGFMGLVTLVSVLNALAWRDPAHLYYAVHAALGGLVVMSNTGLAGEYLWPDSAWLNDIASVVVPVAGLGWLCLLVREIVAERGRPLVSRVLQALAVVAFAIAIAFVAVGRQPVFFFYNLFALAGLLVLLGVLGWFAVRRPRVGLWVFAGVAVLTTGALFPLLRNLGLLPVSAVTQYSLVVAWVLEIPLLLVGLHNRSRQRRDNRIRLEAMARTDPLTGVASHRLLLRRLRRALRVAGMDAGGGAVLRVRVRNLDTLRSEHGREAAEAALLRTGECVALEAKEQDMVAREQDGDFVLLLEGAIARQQVAEAGRNIIARGLKFSPRLPPGATLVLDIAAATLPVSSEEPHELLQLLEGQLQQIAADAQGRHLRIVPDAHAPSSTTEAHTVLSAPTRL